MPLPEKVIEQLGREPAKTPGWSFGLIMFSGTILFIVVVIYVGLVFGYEPYLSTQVSAKQDQITQLSQSISADDQAKLINFYSQISNLKTLLRNHVSGSQLFSWIEKNTQAKVYYQSFGLAPGNLLTLSAVAPTQADVDQQIAIFEASPEVTKVSVSSVATAPSGGILFNVTLLLSPTIFSRSGV